LKPQDGGLLLKLAFYVIQPALILLTIIPLHLSINLLYLPLIAILIQLANATIAFFVGKQLRLPKATLGVFIIATTMMNDQFVLPFFVSVFGQKELGKFLLFDLGNAAMSFSFAYAIACMYGERKAT